MAKLSLLIKSTLGDNGVENHVIGQVKGAPKAAHIVSQKFAQAGLVEQSKEVDANGITKIGTNDDGQSVAFSSVFKNGL